MYKTISAGRRILSSDRQTPSRMLSFVSVLTLCPSIRALWTSAVLHHCQAAFILKGLPMHHNQKFSLVYNTLNYLLDFLLFYGC